MKKELEDELNDNNNNKTKLIIKNKSLQSNKLLEKLHNEYRKLISFQRELNGRYSLKYKRISLFMRAMEEEIRKNQGNYIENKKYKPIDNKHVKWLKIFNDKKSIMIKYEDKIIFENKNQTMTEFKRNQSNDNDNKSNKNDNKPNKFEFRDFKPAVFKEQKYDNLFTNKINKNSIQQQYEFNQNIRNNESNNNQSYNNERNNQSYNNNIRNQIYKNNIRNQSYNNNEVRNPFSTQRQMPNIPQTHRGHININNLNSVYESQPKGNIPMEFKNIHMNPNINNRQQQNYNMRPPVNFQNINSQYINNQPNFNINPPLAYNRNNSPYNPRNPLLRENILNSNNSSHQNINKPFSVINNPLFSKKNDNYIPLNNTILGIDDSLRIEKNNKQLKKLKKSGKRSRSSVEAADSLQSLSSGDTEKVEKRTKLKKPKIKTYTYFYSKTDIFGSESVRGYDITQDPCNLFDVYNVFKNNNFTPKQSITCDLLKEMEKDMKCRLNLRKITNLLIFLKNKKNDKETEILKEFLGKENSIVFLNIEEVEQALKIMFP